MSAFSYQTIQSPAEGLYKEKGSKFLAFAHPVKSESEIKLKLDDIRQQYFDARHHCYAWMLGAEKKYFRAFDDGEPNHSAGDPILGQIRSKNLTNVLVVVVRYFGGTKLGVSGLIAAYKTASENALSNAQVIVQEVMEDWVLKYPYDTTAEMMRIVKSLNLIIVTQHFEEACTMKVAVRLRDKDMLLDKIKLLQATGHPVTLEINY